MMKVLGIDCGTSAVKVVVAELQGNGPESRFVLVDEARSDALPIFRVSELRPGGETNSDKVSEQDPESWWGAVRQACARLAESSRAGVATIAVCGQMHGLVCVDADGAPLCRAQLWNDSRCAREANELDEMSGFRERASNMVMPGFTAPKIRWMARHFPAVLEKAHMLLLPKDFINFKLTGVFATDVSDAAGTLMVDPCVRTRWDAGLVAMTAAGVFSDAFLNSKLPPILESTQSMGVAKPDVLRLLGVDAGKPVHVLAGAADNAAAALGSGAAQAGSALVSLGTSGVVLVPASSAAALRPNPAETVHCFSHCLPQTWYHMTVTLTAASALSWLSDIVLRKTLTPAQLLEELETWSTHDITVSDEPAAPAPLETSLLFLPYLSGERSPINDPHATGAFFGLTHGTAPWELTLAVIEGVAFALSEAANALGEDTLSTITPPMRCVGGGARSRIWRQLLADFMKIPLRFSPSDQSSAALGAAKLAAIGFLAAGEHSGQARLLRMAHAISCAPDEVGASECVTTPNMTERRQEYLCRKRSALSALYRATKTLP